MSDDSTDSSDYELSESVSRFRGAGTNISEGVEHLYYGGKQKVKAQHPTIQVSIAVVMWFGGNWVYNRIKTPVLHFLAAVADAIPAEFLTTPAFGIAGVLSMPMYVQLLGILSGVIIAQNRTHTQKLKEIENEVNGVNDTPATATDGGTRRERKKSGGGGVGGAIAGGFAGASFGPGGALAGAFLGYIIGENMTEENDDADLPTEFDAES